MGYRRTDRPDDSQLLDVGANSPSPCFKAHVLFFTNRLRRGGFRTLYQVPLLLFLALILSRAARRGRDSWNWSSVTSRDAGRLRVVVFGSQDVYGSSLGVDSPGMTWTEQLCKGLNCYSYLSLVPEAGSSRALTSDVAYADQLAALEQRMNATDPAAAPALNYDFVLQQFPVPRRTMDLEAQLQHFLSLPPEPIAPRSTLWVMSFGTWDVWNVAALPLDLGEKAVDAAISGLFAQVEVLYRNAMDSTSVAYSDYWAGASKSDLRRLAGLESFQLVIPTLLDVTLTPGWQTRPDPPTPHNKAEQMRNAAVLTKRWNFKVEEQLGQWAARGSERPEALDKEGVQDMLVTRAATALEYILGAVRTPGSRQMKGRGVKEDVVHTPYPRRAGLQCDLAAVVLDAMTEGEMQRSHVQDGQGRGTWALDNRMRFMDVWNPCLTADGARVGSDSDSDSGAKACANPDHYLFHDNFTVSSRAVQELARVTAERVSDELLASEMSSVGR